MDRCSRLKQLMNGRDMGQVGAFEPSFELAGHACQCEYGEFGKCFMLLF